ncbi:cytochrome P450 [Trametes coccinea BRFM310]|uniref:Cytochrome P450 n=1 Tax=Trametes coccinea (strain BRFM310) TaxID=1353009 RepID=A0A1Y2I802_TRAC3|nr:cytochrome P450 [Trametes coccinea BRFM310]
MNLQMWLSVILWICPVFLVVLWPQIRRRIKQLQLRNVPGPSPTSFWNGLSKELHSPFAVPYREKVLTLYGGVIRLDDFLGDVHLAISDPLALATIFGKYRDSYDTPESRIRSMRTVFGGGLTGTKGQEHSDQRRRLSPVFSVRYLREMVPTFNRVAAELIHVMRGAITQPQTEVEIAEYISRFSLECVGRAALGYSFGPLEKHGTDYSRALKEFGPTIVQLNRWRAFLPFLQRVFPRSWLRFGAEVIPYEPLQRMRGISDSVNATARQILQQKKETLQKGDKMMMQELGEGKDLIAILMQHNAKDPNDISSFSEEDLVGQMSMLLLQATDTTSTTLVRTVQQLALHPDAQLRMREELTEATSRIGRTLLDLDFDSFTQLPYMDAVIRETIRLYPGFYMASRVSPEDTVLPLRNPIQGKNGELMNELHVPAGTTVWLNIFGVNRDKTIWGPDEAEWKPERWLAPLPATVADARIPSVYSNTMTFVAGSRSCIGYNFALAEMRVLLAHLVLNFEIAPSDKEIVWKMSGIASPSVKGSKTTKPEMPVRLTPI